MRELSPEAEARDMELVPTRTGRGPFVSGPRAAAKAAVGLRHRPAGQVFSKKKMGGGTVPLRPGETTLCLAAKVGRAGARNAPSLPAWLPAKVTLPRKGETLPPLPAEAAGKSNPRPETRNLSALQEKEAIPLGTASLCL